MSETTNVENTTIAIDTKCDNENPEKSELKSGQEEEVKESSQITGKELLEKSNIHGINNDGTSINNKENFELERDQEVDIKNAAETEAVQDADFGTVQEDSSVQKILTEDVSKKDSSPTPNISSSEPEQLKTVDETAEAQTKTEPVNSGTNLNSKQITEHKTEIGELEANSQIEEIQKVGHEKFESNTVAGETMTGTLNEELKAKDLNAKTVDDEKTRAESKLELIASPTTLETKDEKCNENTLNVLEENDLSTEKSSDKTDEQDPSREKQITLEEVESSEAVAENNGQQNEKDQLDTTEKELVDVQDLKGNTEQKVSQDDIEETINNQSDKADTAAFETEIQVAQKVEEQVKARTENEEQLGSLQLPTSTQITPESTVEQHAEEATEVQQDKEKQPIKEQEQFEAVAEEQQAQKKEEKLATKKESENEKLELQEKDTIETNEQLAITDESARENQSTDKFESSNTEVREKESLGVEQNKSAELSETKPIESPTEEKVTKVTETVQSTEESENSEMNAQKTNEVPTQEKSNVFDDLKVKTDENSTPTKHVDEIVAVIEIDDDNEDGVGKQADTKKTDDEPKPVETENATQNATENATESSTVLSDTVAKTSDDIIEIDDEDDDDTDSGALKIDETQESNDDQPTAKTPNAEVANDTTIADRTADEQVSKEDDSKTEDATTIAKMHTMPIIFYKKECINFECPKTHKEFHRAPQFALNYFKISKKKMKIQYICGDCYDVTLSFYQEFCGILEAKQPILMKTIANKKQEFVEILDSSDEDESDAVDSENKEPENPAFSKADLDLIEAELHSTIRNVFENVEIQNQLTWSKTIFTERVKKLQEELEYIDAELGETQKMADRMYNDLYDSGKYRINTLKPLDLDSETEQIPPLGEVERPPIKLGGVYYAARNKAIACWVPCKVNEQVDTYLFVPHYRIKFIHTQCQPFKNISAKLLAYFDAPTVRLAVGQRVIAYFDGSTLPAADKEKNLGKSAFYPGIIAEEMKPNNFYRYLIFYDDGYTQYVSHKDVRLVCHVARNVWEDVDHVSREFIKKYVQEYRVNRPMVQTHKGQKMTTEKNGRWVPARVIDIDCSLVRMQFEGPKGNHTEWIYRGSLRLNPVFMEYQKSKSNQANRMPISRLPRRTEPFIRYTDDEENLSTQQQQQQQQQQSQQTSRTLNRSNSTSSATSSAPTVRHLNANTIYLEDEKPKGKVIYYTAKRQMPTRVYRPHDCGPHCLLVIPHNLNGYNPLAKPLLSGWERLFSRQKIKKTVYYRAPCGKMFRNMGELHHYLRATKCSLNVDNFDFYAETSCLAEFEAENVHLKKRDISNGQEKLPLPLINYYDDTLPECTYSSKVIPTEGVNINTEVDFLICCDCEDDCVDKSKCACWKLTIEGVKTINPDAQTDDIGYQYKRLYDHLPTGIYECNSRCKCKSHCLNRVVQHSLGLKLQVFKTTNRGWGLRCLNDIPRGSFVCVYAGNLLTEAKANEGGLDAGDEYFAELDYIETVEQLKEGYESDVETQEEEDEDSYEPEAEDDVDFQPSRSTERRVRRGTASGGAINEGERQAINFNPKVAMEDDSKKKRLSVRQLFGKDEAVYVMDAKVTGNLGRYFNHSCAPNLFVQNVFVDTHDIRFPCVAFFSLTHIRAGTELTWNYNYEVGVVPGKVLYCQCGAPNCRQRLL